jgi:phospholipid/cholesterol/gamma-HCH transport system substrate-binding protein
MSTPRTDRELVKIAIVGLAVMAVLFGLAINYQRLPGIGAGTQYHADFTDAAGLVPGEEVRVAGIKVGTVSDITLGHQMVVVTFDVKGVRLGDDTRAGIEVKTLLGQHYLSITPAGSGSLPGGTTIPLARTSTPVNVVPAFEQLATQAQQIDTHEVAAAFDALASTLHSTAPQMTETLRGLSRISESVTSRDNEIRALFERTSQVSGIVAARDQDIAALLTDTDTVLAELNRRRQTITQIIDGTGALARELSGLVSDNQAQLRPTLTKLNDVLAVLRKNRANLDDALRVGEVYAREFVNVGGSGRWFDSSIKAPDGIALCTTGGTGSLPGPLDALLGSILSQIDGQVNHSNKPCVPLGPATGGSS